MLTAFVIVVSLSMTAGMLIAAFSTGALVVNKDAAARLGLTLTYAATIAQAIGWAALGSLIG